MFLQICAVPFVKDLRQQFPAPFAHWFRQGLNNPLYNPLRQDQWRIQNRPASEPQIQGAGGQSREKRGLSRDSPDDSRFRAHFCAISSFWQYRLAAQTTSVTVDAPNGGRGSDPAIFCEASRSWSARRGVSMSLAGVQTKVAVALDQTGRICVPMNGSPSTHILKPDAPRLWGGVQNEAFCLTLARRLKIPTPRVTTGQAGKRTYLLVKRFDRTEANGRWRRLHQEDFCQALGKPPSAKYEANQTGIRGPALTDMFELTRRHMPSIDIVHLLDMVVVNVLVCNTDAHLRTTQ
jgi:hypothetical protein